VCDWSVCSINWPRSCSSNFLGFYSGGVWVSLGWGTSCPDWECSWYTSVSPLKFQDNNLIRSQQFLSESFPIHHTPDICYCLIIKNRIFFDKLTFRQLLKKIPMIYGNWRFLTVFKRSWHLSLFVPNHCFWMLFVRRGFLYFISHDTAGQAMWQAWGRNLYMVLVGKSDGKRLRVRPGCRWDDNIKINYKELYK
jgi:hypothetical protein